eukprot:gene10870-22695_t
MAIFFILLYYIFIFGLGIIEGVDPPRSLNIGLFGDKYQSDGEVDENGILNIAAMLLALSEINNKSDGLYDDILPKTHLKFALRSTKGDFLEGSNGAQDFALRVFNGSGVVGVIGTGHDQASRAMGQTFGFTPFKVNNVDYGANASDLSHGSYYPYYVRTCASNAYEGRILARLIKQHFKWGIVSVFSTADTYGTDISSEFFNEAIVQGISIEHKYSIWPGTTNFESILETTKSTGILKVFVLLMKSNDAAMFLEAGYNAQLFKEGTQILDGTNIPDTAIYAYDAVYGLALSLHKLLYEQKNYHFSGSDLGILLLNRTYMRYDGVSGLITFSPGHGGSEGYGLGDRETDTRLIKSAQPSVLFIILFGGMLAGIKIILATMDITDTLCIIGKWLGHLSFILVFGAIIIRTWRISKVVNSGFSKVNHIDLMKRVLMDIIVFIKSNVRVESKKNAPTAVDDSKYITLALFLIVFICAVTFPIVFLSIEPTPQTLIIIMASGFMFATICVLFILFLPKTNLLLEGADVDETLNIVRSVDASGKSPRRSSNLRNKLISRMRSQQTSHNCQSQSPGINGREIGRSRGVLSSRRIDDNNNNNIDNNDGNDSYFYSGKAGVGASSPAFKNSPKTSLRKVTSKDSIFSDLAIRTVKIHATTNATSTATSHNNNDYTVSNSIISNANGLKTDSPSLLLYDSNNNYNNNNSNSIRRKSANSLKNKNIYVVNECDETPSVKVNISMKDRDNDNDRNSDRDQKQDEERMNNDSYYSNYTPTSTKSRIIIDNSHIWNDSGNSNGNGSGNHGMKISRGCNVESIT